jgi:hypothetical protein
VVRRASGGADGCGNRSLFAIPSFTSTSSPLQPLSLSALDVGDATEAECSPDTPSACSVASVFTAIEVAAVKALKSHLGEGGASAFVPGAIRDMFIARPPSFAQQQLLLDSDHEDGEEDGAVAVPRSQVVLRRRSDAPSSAAGREQAVLAAD